jgi:hypothetical protein
VSVIKSITTTVRVSCSTAVTILRSYIPVPHPRHRGYIIQ